MACCACSCTCSWWPPPQVSGGIPNDGFWKERLRYESGVGRVRQVPNAWARTFGGSEAQELLASQVQPPSDLTHDRSTGRRYLHEPRASDEVGAVMEWKIPEEAPPKSSKSQAKPSATASTEASLPCHSTWETVPTETVEMTEDEDLPWDPLNLARDEDVKPEASLQVKEPIDQVRKQRMEPEFQRRQRVQEAKKELQRRLKDRETKAEQKHLKLQKEATEKLQKEKEKMKEQITGPSTRSKKVFHYVAPPRPRSYRCDDGSSGGHTYCIRSYLSRREETETSPRRSASVGSGARSVRKASDSEWPSAWPSAWVSRPGSAMRGRSSPFRREPTASRVF
eukprot:TRINITY_DN8774_c0_g1_i3.p1 TRINITY_DN8774_c0_g1~~TRINITY_DN8774_c0_g1_i3.p1  ORF type:complete len:338 (+),score=76.09 TRINITY_DN8774_c0_g1_i3:445-1458(+)